MKAGYSKSTHYIAIVLAILAVSALLAFVQNAQAAEAVGRIAKFDGHVDILRGGKLPAVPAKVNDTVFVGDVVRTKTDAKAEIAFSDGNVIKVAQKSRIDISEYAPNSKASLRMPRGKVEAIVEKKIAQRISLSKNANSFEIRTPNAVAGVRGTHFFVINDRNATSVLVKDGTVNVANIRHPEAGVNVGAGHMTTVIGLNPPKQPQPVKEADMKKQEKDTTPTEKKDKKDKAEGGDKGSSEAKSGDQPKDQAKTGDQPQDQGKSKDNSGSKSDSGKSDNTAASGGTTPSGGDSGGSGGSASAGGPGGSTPSFVASATEEAHDTFTSLSQTASTTGTGNLGNLGNAGAGNTGTDKQDPPRRQVTETLQQATTPPKVTISSGPKSQTKANTANFNLTVDDSSATLSYSLDGGPWTQMSGISLTLSNLTEGNHSIEVKGTDTAGNTSTPISYSWTTDYTRATMSSTSDTIQKPVRITDGSYSTISAPGGSYSYSYSDQHKWGSVTYTGSTTGYGVEYTPDGKSIRYDYTYDSTTGTWQKNAGQTAGTWDTSKTLSSQIGSLMGISLPASLDSKHTDDHDDGTFSVAGTIKSPGSLWSTTSSNPATVALSGTVTRNSTSPHRWGAFLTNNSDQSYVFKTDDGGAFIGGALTRESGGALDGKFIGFYVDPSGNAGIMRSDISGSLDATTGAYSLSGATYPEQLPSITGLIPSNFADRLIIKDYYPNDFAKSLSSYNSYGTSTYNAYNDSDFSGPHSFSGNSGAIKGRSSNRITTISIADPNTASATYNMTFPSGVFIEDFKGSFTGALSAWTAKTGNSGAFGSYNLDKNHAGTYNYADGGKYRYHYTTGTNNSGSSVYTVASGRYERPSQQVSYTIYYYSDGTTETITDVYHPDGDSFSSNTVKGTWDTTLSPSALVATPPVKDYPDSANYTSKHSRDGASDLGYWLADVTGGTWAGGKLSGSLTGNFITKTKLGTLSGDILGVYDANDSSWIADALGKYDGTPLKFVSSLSGSMEASQRLYYQHYKYSAVNDFYEYTYNNNEKVGHVTYQRYDLSTPVWYDIEYNSDGTTTRTDHYYDSTKLTFTTTTQTQGTWDTTQPVLSSIATTPPDASYTSSTSGDFPTNAFDGSLNAL
ncbi:MAG TPA: FecR family protein, partial [Dissulfurispiraceae bacterium]